MNKKIVTLTALSAIIAGALLWWFSDTQVLTRRSSALIDCIDLEPDTSRVQRALKSENLRDLIADNVVVSYPEMESTFQHTHASSEPITLSRDIAKSSLLHLSVIAEWIKVENEKIEVLEASDDSAKVNVSFDLSAKLKGKKEQSAQLQGVFIFSKTDGKWLVSEARF